MIRTRRHLRMGVLVTGSLTLLSSCALLDRAPLDLRPLSVADSRSSTVQPASEPKAYRVERSVSWVDDAVRVRPPAPTPENPMGNLKIVVAADFSPYLGGRCMDGGKNSGEEFRETLLWPTVNKAISHSGHVTIVLDGVVGYPDSFLEEAFGGTVRQHKIDANVLLNTIDLETTMPNLSKVVNKIHNYINHANDIANEFPFEEIACASTYQLYAQRPSLRE